MTVENRFQVVFDNLDEALSESQEGNKAEPHRAELRKASEEIAELRRAVLEISEPPVSLFTTT